MLAYFSEVRRIRNGPMTVPLAIASMGSATGALFISSAPVQVALGVLAVVGFWLLATAGVHTIVRNGKVIIRVVPFRTRRFAVADIVDAEVIIADNLVELFGGSDGGREGWADAAIEQATGASRSVGNKAVRMTLANGDVVQVGSWRPAELLTAIGRPPR